MNELAMFSNIFGPDMIIVLVILLLLFGAKKLPELARGLGQSLNEFKKARDDFEHELMAKPDVSIQPAANLQARETGSSPTDLQRQVAELQEQLRVAQAPKLTAPAEDTAARP